MAMTRRKAADCWPWLRSLTTCPACGATGDHANYVPRG
jgi:hypothetical protein